VALRPLSSTPLETMLKYSVRIARLKPLYLKRVHEIISPNQADYNDNATPLCSTQRSDAKVKVLRMSEENFRHQRFTCRQSRNMIEFRMKLPSLADIRVYGVWAGRNIDRKERQGGRVCGYVSSFSPFLFRLSSRVACRMNKMGHALLHDDDSCFKITNWSYTTATDNYIVPAVRWI